METSTHELTPEENKPPDKHKAWVCVWVYYFSLQKAKKHPYRIFWLIYSKNLIDVSQHSSIIYMALKNGIASFFTLTAASWLSNEKSIFDGHFCDVETCAFI